MPREIKFVDDVEPKEKYPSLPDGYDDEEVVELENGSQIPSTPVTAPDPEPDDGYVSIRVPRELADKIKSDTERAAAKLNEIRAFGSVKVGHCKTIRFDFNDGTVEYRNNSMKAGELRHRDFILLPKSSYDSIIERLDALEGKCNTASGL